MADRYQQQRGCGPLPNRWLHCPRNSTSFITDKFLAFKTPLCARFNAQIPFEYRFPPSMVFSYAKTCDAKLGLWIDLTNTNRFYDRQEIEENKCRYIKLKCRGHGETPSTEQTQSFIEIVHDFIEMHPISFIGIHCTHGYNRTGFLIVSYMVEKMDCSVDAALKAFAVARPPGIYKDDYIKELFRRYDDEEDAIEAPPLPNWCLEYDDEDTTDADNTFGGNNLSRKRKASTDNNENDTVADDDNDAAVNDNEDDDDEDRIVDQKRIKNGESGGSSSSGSTPTKSGNSKPAKKKRKREFINVNATFMAGVPGISLVLDQPRLETLQSTVQDICNWKSGGFPGCQPVSMTQENINLLHVKPYRVSWKADGTRYMMLILNKGEIYFFDRDNSCFQVNGLHFLNPKDFNKHISNTLVDGEMVIDKVNGENIPRYLIYDIIRYENEDVSKLSFFPDRLRCIETNLIAPRYKAFATGQLNRQREPFGVRNKVFYEILQTHSLMGPKFAKLLSHEPDGLIFQPSKDPYTPGQCQEVLKWKPAHMNSVDFRLEIAEESGIGILTKKIGNLFVGRHTDPVANIKYTKALKDLHNKIIECKFQNNEWVFMRERTDKSFPNSLETAKSVFNSIKFPVTNVILLNFIDNNRFIDDTDIMPPPTGRPMPNHHQQQQQHQHHQSSAQHQSPSAQDQSTAQPHSPSQQQQKQQQQQQQQQEPPSHQ